MSIKEDIDDLIWKLDCVESVRIWSFSGPYFSALGMNKEISDKKNSE